MTITPYTRVPSNMLPLRWYLIPSAAYLVCNRSVLLSRIGLDLGYKPVSGSSAGNSPKCHGKKERKHIREPEDNLLITYLSRLAIRICRVLKSRDA